MRRRTKTRQTSDAILAILSDGMGRTAEEIRIELGSPAYDLHATGSTVTARIRDLRKPDFGGHDIRCEMDGARRDARGCALRVYRLAARTPRRHGDTEDDASSRPREKVRRSPRLRASSEAGGVRSPEQRIMAEWARCELAKDCPRAEVDAALARMGHSLDEVLAVTDEADEAGVGVAGTSSPFGAKRRSAPAVGLCDRELPRGDRD